MHISLIGMAGTGKSFWSSRLSEMGFRCFSCDAFIEKKLIPDLKKPDGTTITMGEWMGFPYSPDYRKCEATYLSYEREVLSEIIDLMEDHAEDPRGNTVIDTAGSVIYTDEGLLRRLGRRTKLVHLSTPKDVQREILKIYLSEQGPVIWRDFFNREQDETNEEALARCFPKLLMSRERAYRKIAHVTIDYGKHRRKGFGVEDFLDEIRPYC